jgi:hypothetical protein
MATLSGRDLTLDAGETLQFPISDGADPLAAIQQMRPIANLSDVADFQFVQDILRGFSRPSGLYDRPPGAQPLPEPDLPATPTSTPQGYTGGRVSLDELLRLIRERSGGTVMTLDLGDFVVPPGSTAVLTAPLNVINANTVVIAGELRFTDDLTRKSSVARAGDHAPGYR